MEVSIALLSSIKCKLRSVKGPIAALNLQFTLREGTGDDKVCQDEHQHQFSSSISDGRAPFLLIASPRNDQLTPCLGQIQRRRKKKKVLQFVRHNCTGPEIGASCSNFGGKKKKIPIKH